jgi:hypothetical protein
VRRITTISLALLAAISCARSSQPEEVVSDRGYKFLFEKDYYFDVELPFEDVWANVLSALEDLEWETDSEVQTAGMIVTKETTIGTNRDRYACRQWPGSATRVDEMRCRLAIQVGSGDGTITRVRAFANLEGRYLYISSIGDERVGGWWPCTSTGVIEAELFDDLLSRLEPLIYSPPVYRRPGAAGEHR